MRLLIKNLKIKNAKKIMQNIIFNISFHYIVKIQSIKHKLYIWTEIYTEIQWTWKMQIN